MGCEPCEACGRRACGGGVVTPAGWLCQECAAGLARELRNGADHEA